MEKITAATVLDDSPTYENIGGETKSYPNNVTNDYKGLISVRYALKVSNNIATSKSGITMLTGKNIRNSLIN